MASEIESSTARSRYGLVLTALAPVIPQIFGSAFNIWYNATVIEPMLTAALRQRFFDTVVVYNAVVYPVGVYLWLKRIFSFRGLLDRLQPDVGGQTVPLQELTQARRRLIHLPWFAAAICGVAWFLCIPVLTGALLQVQNPLDPRLLWHLPISFCVSGFIAVTHSFFLVELASQWGIFPFSSATRAPNSNWNWNSFRSGNCGQHRFAPTAGVHCRWQHCERRIARARPDQEGRQTSARHRRSARSVT